MSLSSSSNAYNMPWVEKYRPIKMICSMVELTVQQVEKLREMSPLYEFVKEVLHVSDVYEEERHALAVCFALEIASGISKMFAQKKVTLSPGRHKIVILDEADR
ncbi:Replication factor C subunit 4 [Glycine soja]